MNTGNIKKAFKKLDLKEKDFKKESNLEKKLIKLRNENKKNFGNYIVSRDNSNGELYLIKDKLFSNYNDASEEIIKAKNKINFEHPNLLKLRDYSTKIENHFCSKSYWIKLIYDYPENDLEQIIIEKNKNNVIFGEEEIVHLLYQQVYAGAYLEQNKQFHGNIRPELIAIIADKGVSLLIDDDEIQKGESLSVQIMNYNKKNNLYVSELLFNQIINQEKDFNYDKNKEDVFSLGLILLEAGINQSIQKIYERSKKKFNHDLLLSYIENFKNKFCPPGEEGNNLICSTLEFMLNLDENERPSFNEIKVNLPSYNEIINYYNSLEEKSQTELNYSNLDNDENNINYSKNENFEELVLNNQINNKFENNNQNYNVKNSNPYLNNNNFNENELENRNSYALKNNNNNEFQNIEKENVDESKPPSNDGIKYYKDPETNLYYFVDENGESKWYEPNNNFMKTNPNSEIKVNNNIESELNLKNKNYSNNYTNNQKESSSNYNPDEYVVYIKSNGEKTYVKKSELKL